MDCIRKVCYVYGNDWAGLYIDSQLVDQDHRLTPPQIINHLRGLLVQFESTLIVSDEYLEEFGFFPNRIEELKRTNCYEEDVDV